MKKTATAAKAPAKRTSSKSGRETNTMLQELFIDSIKDLYWAEKHLTKALPKMQKAATTSQLQQAFGDHLVQTKEQITRLEEVFEILGKAARGKKCEAMEGLVKEGESIIEDTEDGTATRDVGLILAAQKVEHYEIASYGGLVQLAKTLGHDQIAEILEVTLNEEKDTDLLLTEIAENDINYEASTEGK